MQIMKFLQKSILLFLLAGALFSCEKLQDINDNPNNAPVTHPKLLLKDIAWNAFDGQGTGSMFASRVMVSSDGASNEQYYTWDRDNFDRYNQLRNITKMMEEADKQGTPEYTYLAHFFRAYQFYQLTRRFGDIPYSDALKGETDGVYAPKYDEQSKIIPALLDELKAANEGLKSVTYIDGDIIYGGDPMKWRKLINSFRLRILMNLSNKANDATLDIPARFRNIYQNEPLMESIDDAGQLVYLDQKGSRYFEFLGKFGSVGMDSTFVQLLKDRQDPRLFVFCQPNPNAVSAGLPVNDFDAYGSADPTLTFGAISDERNKGYVSMVNPRYFDDPVNEPHKLMGYEELQFILAEATVRGWIEGGDLAKAKAFYNEGIKASFLFYRKYAEKYAAYLGDGAIAEYLNQPMVNFDNATTFDERIRYIITQKYIQFYFQTGWEQFYNHRRTGYPKFLTGGAVGNNGQVPVRWMYPEDEYNTNAVNVQDAVARQFNGDDNINGTIWLLK
ncbi:SusD-like starch-binding protein associating with outer membrane [Prolixibacter denitrificans]|uniref:SusD-like starch-binding protein associating with outer membrane n=2 Tax=Prolixibacter denitrificans TaxID=1541063 RepID=A0A2P8CDY6_9BACT|nr:SusD-like starch-binding protein associating with outer membrane [Prolixibacter denitrificans]GET21923.1 hypothetical protein JCM18694_21690 [Prolixibacter denitrificans]